MSVVTNTNVPGAVASRHMRRRIMGFCLLAGLALAFLFSVGFGAVTISPGQILALLAKPLGLDLPWSYGQREETILYAIRLPRACLGMMTGAALAVAGAALQGLFRNPLADPALIGVSTGAALAASVVIVFSAGWAATMIAPLLPYLLPIAAFGGGLLTTLIVYMIANRDGQTDVATMLLAGVALNAIAAAGIGLLVFISDDQQLRDLNFWLLGSLGGVTWARLLPAAPFICIAIIALPLMARHLNAMLLGEREALHLGFHVERTKRVIIIMAALAVGASVALTGVIGFIGLMVPHLVRLVMGPDHRALMPASVILGATLLLVADLAARTIALPAELPIGILTSCVGGPFFLWLLMARREKGGW
ncbi:MAG: iron ABC transporter permease [Alphaproteobacteria bacterium]|nr:iron ABC transporter permease [Alphaproteobacteria bacterium]